MTDTKVRTKKDIENKLSIPFLGEIPKYQGKDDIIIHENGRDSIGRRLGAKKADGEIVRAGNIIYRQRGTKIYPGTNVGIGKDHTLYSLIDGKVKYERKGRDKKQVSVYMV